MWRLLSEKVEGFPGKAAKISILLILIGLADTIDKVCAVVASHLIADTGHPIAGIGVGETRPARGYCP